jgi:hypothetical protein
MEQAMPPDEQHIEVKMSPNVATLFRPTGERELALIRDSGWSAFPPRLPDQPFFYPVLNEGYATQIARDWIANDGGTGYVLRFRVDVEFLARYGVQTVGASVHREDWVPAGELTEFNEHIVGPIEVIAVYSAADAQS